MYAKIIIGNFRNQLLEFLPLIIIIIIIIITIIIMIMIIVIVTITLLLLFCFIIVILTANNNALAYGVWQKRFKPFPMADLVLAIIFSPLTYIVSARIVQDDAVCSAFYVMFVIVVEDVVCSGPFVVDGYYYEYSGLYCC